MSGLGYLGRNMVWDIGRKTLFKFSQRKELTILFWILHAVKESVKFLPNICIKWIGKKKRGSVKSRPTTGQG